LSPYQGVRILLGLAAEEPADSEIFN